MLPRGKCGQDLCGYVKGKVWEGNHILTGWSMVLILVGNSDHAAHA